MKWASWHYWNRGLLGVKRNFYPVLLCGFLSGVTLDAPAAARSASFAPAVEQWSLQEVSLQSGRAYKNPFADVRLQGQFTNGAKHVVVEGFYDGERTWKVRLMPEVQGRWTFLTVSNDPGLNGKSGEFTVTPPGPDNHGPVRAAKTYHFSYADGTPYFLLGTTSYNWLNRGSALEDRTLATLVKNPFTKIRFGLFPLWYEFNRVDPPSYPYVQVARRKFDLDRFNPKFFDHVERRLRDLQKLGIIADIILFLPYDDWGFARMDAVHDDAYIRYVTARLAAFRNVWWTMANEYNFFDPSFGEGSNRLPSKNWDRMFQVLQAADPYVHERGMHNAGPWYDPSKAWVTHIIAQEDETAARLTLKARRLYRKPVVIDEYGYEGDMWPSCNLSPTQGVERHWEITMAGGYASHGECYVRPDGGYWWSVGGELASDAPKRLGFLKDIMAAAPYQDLVPSPQRVMGGTALAKPKDYYLFRFATSGALAPLQIRTEGAGPFKVDLIDPWQMKVFPLGYTSAGVQAFTLAMAPSLLRFTKVDSVDPRLPRGPLTELLATFAGETAPPVNPKAPPFRVEPEHFSTNFTLGELLADARARGVLEKYAPAVTQLAASRSFLQGFPLVPSKEDGSVLLGEVRIDAARFAELSAELAKIPVE